MNHAKQLTAMENDVQALKALNAMNAAEHERLLGKLLLLTAQVALEAHGEFKLANKIGDFLTTPFASISGDAQAGENGSCPNVGVGALPPNAKGDSRLIFPRAHPSSAGNGAVFPARPQIHLCNKERRSIVRSAEERGK